MRCSISKVKIEFRFVDIDSNPICSSKTNKYSENAKSRKALVSMYIQKINIICLLLNNIGGRRSQVVTCWASDSWVASSNPLGGKFRH